MRNKIIPHDVFICYESTTGKSYVENLKEALEKGEHNAFLADITLKGGDDWKEKINSALNECKYFIVVITTLTMDSEWVKREYKKAECLGKRIIPCRYSGISISETGKLEEIRQLEFLNTSELANKVIIEIRKISREEKKGVKIKEDPREFLKRGNLLFNLRKFNEALKAFDKAIKINPDNAYAWYNKGVVIGKELRKYDEAIKCFNKAIEIKPDFAYALNNKGNALGKLKKHDEAIKCYNKAIRIKPDYAYAWNNKACAYSIKGDKENALKNLSRAIELNAEFKEEAKKDEDFKNLWGDEDFKKIIG